MAIVIPDVTQLTAASNVAEDYMAAIETHIVGTSTKWSKVQGASDGFTIAPTAVAEEFQVNLRTTSTTVTKVLIDPLENITDAGGSATPPTLTSSAEWSEEADAFQITGSESLDFYLIELDDAIFILILDAGLTHIPRATHFGRTWIPFFSDGTNGDYYADGLGIHGYLPIVSAASGVGHWFSSSTTTSRIRCAQSGGYTAGDPAAAWYQPANLGNVVSGTIQGRRRWTPFPINAIDVDGSTDATIGYTKYIVQSNVAQLPGFRLEAGLGLDAWIHINETAVVDDIIIPWVQGLVPIFG